MYLMWITIPVLSVSKNVCSIVISDALISVSVTLKPGFLVLGYMIYKTDKKNIQPNEGPCVMCIRGIFFSRDTCCSESRSRTQIRTNSCSPCSPPHSGGSVHTLCRDLRRSLVPSCAGRTPDPPCPETPPTRPGCSSSGSSPWRWGCHRIRMAGLTCFPPRQCCSTGLYRCDCWSSSLECGLQDGWTPVARTGRWGRCTTLILRCSDRHMVVRPHPGPPAVRWNIRVNNLRKHTNKHKALVVMCCLYLHPSLALI